MAFSHHPHIRSILAAMFIVALLAAFILPLQAVPRLKAAPAVLPEVVYDATDNTIHIGNEYIDPIWSGYPSHPDAPKQPINIIELHTQLVQAGYPNILRQAGTGVWLSTANIEVKQTARLELTSPTMSVLRLDSTPSSSAPGYVFLMADGGHLLIQGITVTSWNSTRNAVDQNYSDGRSFLLADKGARMDIINSEIAYLGWSAGKPSGLSWRRRATQNNIQTGSTGSIINSTIHHLYFGQYSYEAYGLTVDASKFHDNVSYGFDPHDYSMNFEVKNSEFYNNGNHGIIFSRGCENNVISGNIVHDNQGHGIMLDRGSNNNTVIDNTVYNNSDGIAVHQSADNLIKQNELYDNNRGIRVNASYDNDDRFDGISIGNTLEGNTIRDNAQYGIYLYRRADQNTIIDNEITGSGSSGIYIKTGDNIVENNRIVHNGIGIYVWGEPEPSIVTGVTPPVEAASEPGYNNHLYGNTIEENAGEGIRIRQSTETLIGPGDIAINPQQRNLIRSNGATGIRIYQATSHTMVQGNLIHSNEQDGVVIEDATSNHNTISRNSITANGGSGIQLEDSANDEIPAPVITSGFAELSLMGTAPPNTTIEVYRDADGEGNTYEGQIQTDGSGAWSFQLTESSSRPNTASVVAIDETGNTSEFTSNGPVTANLVYEIGSDPTTGAQTIYINGPGSVLTLPVIQEDLQELDAGNLLENQGNGVWQANASIFIGRDVQLLLTSHTVSWLKLRSQSSDITLSADTENQYNYNSFTSVRLYNGELILDGVRVTSWDPTANGGEGDYDRDISNGRSYLLAKYDARMDILSSEISYLGSPDGESYGISWRDTNSSTTPDELRTRVTGDVIDSTLSHNYYGIYTYQASHMTFRGNTFHNNISYGFDPHDFTHHVLVEDNESYENGNHGFIISRGCNNFIFRNNKSYNNRYTVDTKDRNAHGFMLDPGSPNSAYPQVPVSDTLLEGNEAWGNDGYGLRVLGSINNTIQNNTFRDNLQGLTLEQESVGNVVRDNIMSNNQLYGIYLIGGSDTNTISGNQIMGSGRHGIYIKTGFNTITGNTIRQNGTVLEDGRDGAGIALLPERDDAMALADFQLPGDDPLITTSSDLPGLTSLASALTDNRIEQNTLVENADDGIEVKGATNTTILENRIQDNGLHGVYLSAYYDIGTRNTSLTRNTISANEGQGIRANNSLTKFNTWHENSIFDNADGGIANTSGANYDIPAPEITSFNETTITGIAQPEAYVEIFSDNYEQGRYFEGSTVADKEGYFTFTAPEGWTASEVTTVSTESQGNSSEFSSTPPVPTLNNSDYSVHLPLVVR